MTAENESERWKCSCDIELVFPNAKFELLEKIASAAAFSAGYCLEDRSDRGWGSVIARDESWLGDRRDISALVVEFLLPFKFLSTSLVELNSPVIVRLGVYYGTFTLTIQLNREALLCLEQLGAEIEISTYPADDSEG